MRPILPGARGPAVEDIQRRLLKLGFQLGPTGVDGVFLGKTREAVVAFQHRLGLAEDGVVGDETWSALVDETFTFGDRSLYLRVPHFHGRDVRALQQALNALGFACGDDDAIFGVYTERAVREFQRNSGQPVDGIAGLETMSVLTGLRHVWEGKDATIPAGAHTGPARSTELLASESIDVVALGEDSQDVAARFVNLAHAAAPDSSVELRGGTQDAGRTVTLVVMVAAGADERPSGMPVAALGSDDAVSFGARLVTAIAARERGNPAIAIDLGDAPFSPDDRQRAAVRIMDALCIALA